MTEPTTCQYCGGDQNPRGICPRCDAAPGLRGRFSGKGWALLAAAGLLALAVAAAVVGE